MRILLVEDNVLNQELARDLLELAGHQVTVVPDGHTLRAIVVGGGAVPNIVLMDVLLPGADGVTLLRELRTLGPYRVIPIIAVTAQALAGDQQRFFDAGFDGVMTKPIDTRTFVADVEKHASKRA